MVTSHLEFSQEYGKTVRVVGSEEKWTEKRIRGGRMEQQPWCSQWIWAAGIFPHGQPEGQA